MLMENPSGSKDTEGFGSLLIAVRVVELFRIHLPQLGLRHISRF